MIHQRGCECEDCHEGSLGTALLNALSITFVASLLAYVVLRVLAW